MERDLYLKRHLTPLLILSVVGLAGTLLSASQFAAGNAAWFWPVVAATAGYMSISIAVAAFTRDFDGEDHRRRVVAYRPEHWPSVDVLLPTCGEDMAVLEGTWHCVAALHWPGDLEIVVLDDAGDRAVEAMAESFGFRYIARPNRGWFKKAGNLRYGFARTEGELLVVFDADFCPRPDFLHELVPHMEPGVAIVQSPQYFRTLNRHGWLERGAGAVQELFYRVIQVSRAHHGGAICVGSNAVYRRAALEAGGGTTLIEHSEDVHTGFDVSRRGWQLRYVPLPLATGLCPPDVDAFFRQQYRWCSGSMSLLGSRKFWSTPMPWVRRCCYVSGFGYYVFTAAFTIVLPLAPLFLLTAHPELVQIGNYAPLAPGLAYGLLVLPLWHRASYRPEAWTVKMLYGWAHLFAIIDVLRRSPMGWTPTGARGGSVGSRVAAFRFAALLWGGGTALVWVAFALLHAAQRPFDFAPMLALGAFYALTVGRLFVPPRVAPAHRRFSPRLRWATVLALMIALAAPVAALAEPLPQGRFLGVSANTREFPQWRRALGPLGVRHTFQAWGINSDPRKLLAADRRYGTTPMVTWEPWMPPPLGTLDQGRAQPRYSNAAIAAGSWDPLLRRWARVVREYRRPVIMRLAHEMQGFWYPWSQDPAGFRRAWRHVWWVFQRAGARNVVWMWSPNSNIDHDDSRALTLMAEYWPGTRYVDAVGLTAITFGPDARPAAFARRLGLLTQTYGKPGVLAEVNVAYAHREAWMRELRATLRATPAIRGLVWSQQTSRGVKRHAQDVVMDWAGWRDPIGLPILRGIARDLRARR